MPTVKETLLKIKTQNEQYKRFMDATRKELSKAYQDALEKAKRMNTLDDILSSSQQEQPNLTKSQSDNDGDNYPPYYSFHDLNVTITLPLHKIGESFKKDKLGKRKTRKLKEDRPDGFIDILFENHELEFLLNLEKHDKEILMQMGSESLYQTSSSLTSYYFNKVLCKGVSKIYYSGGCDKAPIDIVENFSLPYYYHFEKQVIIEVALPSFIYKAHGMSEPSSQEIIVNLGMKLGKSNDTSTEVNAYLNHCEFVKNDVYNLISQYGKIEYSHTITGKSGIDENSEKNNRIIQDLKR
ncbi:MAG: hypothetical protein MK212_16380 [Saprospiraceae bacterium]|nr:hypothetical protein [Saprospiraceae bacterium]